MMAPSCSSWKTSSPYSSTLSWMYILDKVEEYGEEVFQLLQLEDLLPVLLHLVLDVHLAAVLVLLLAGERVVHAELVGVVLQDLLELVVVELGVRVGHAHEEPAQARELEGGVLAEHAAPEAAVGRDAGARGHHNVYVVGVALVQEERLADGARHHDLVPGLGVAEEVGADALLGRVVRLQLGAPVGGPAHAQGGRLPVELVAVAGGGDRV